MNTVTTMTDDELRAEYLYLCDFFITAFPRLRFAAERGFPTMQNAWFSEVTYRWRWLTDLQEEMERRQADELS